MGMFRLSKFLMVMAVTFVVLIGLTGVTSIDLGGDSVLAGEAFGFAKKSHSKNSKNSLSIGIKTCSELDMCEYDGECLPCPVNAK